MNISFKGYDNVYSAELYSYDGYMRILSARLNNDGNPDLDNFREYILNTTSTHNQENNDIITIVHTKGSEESEFSTGLQSFHDAYKLKKFQTSVKNETAKTEFANIEKNHLHFYTLLTELTNRLSNNNSSIYYSKEVGDKIRNNVFETFLRLTEDEHFAYNIMELFNEENKRKFHFQEIAGKINRFIVKSFKNYF